MDSSLTIIVFGFLQDVFVGEEQGQSYTVQVGYLKGASAGTNLFFNVMDIQGSASQFTNFLLDQNLTKVSADHRRGCSIRLHS